MRFRVAALIKAEQLGLFGAPVRKEVTVKQHLRKKPTGGVTVVHQHERAVERHEQEAKHTEQQAPPTPATPPAERTAEVREFAVLPSKWAALQKRVEKLQKKARKLGMEPPTLRKVGEGTKRVAVPVEGAWGRKEEKYVEVPCYFVEVTGPVLKVPGWHLRAIVTPLETKSGETQNKVTEVGRGVLPTSLWTTDTHCDHCKTTRDRGKVFALQNDSGEWMQCGATCLADYTGQSAQTAAAAAEYSHNFGIGDEEEWLEAPARGYSGGWDLRDILQLAAYAIDQTGGIYISATQAETEGGASTSRLVQDLLFSSEKEKAKTAHYSAVADTVLTWMKAIPEDTDEHYLRNLRSLGIAEVVGEREVGLAASAIRAREVWQQRQARAADQEKKTAGYFGKVGDQIGRKSLSKKDREAGATLHPSRTVTLEASYHFDTEFGRRYVYIVRDDEGHVFKVPMNKSNWSIDLKLGRDKFGGSEGIYKPMSRGETFDLVGTVKRHQEYTDRRTGAKIKQTELIRASLLRKLSDDERPVFDAAAAEFAAKWHADLNEVDTHRAAWEAVQRMHKGVKMARIMFKGCRCEMEKGGLTAAASTPMVPEDLEGAGIEELEKGDEAVSAKIAKLMDEGKPQKQAVAIALSMQRRGELAKAIRGGRVRILLKGEQLGLFTGPPTTVKAHLRRDPSGKVSLVKQHERKTKGGAAKVTFGKAERDMPGDHYEILQDGRPVGLIEAEVHDVGATSRVYRVQHYTVVFHDERVGDKTFSVEKGQNARGALQRAKEHARAAIEASQAAQRASAGMTLEARRAAAAKLNEAIGTMEWGGGKPDPRTLEQMKKDREALDPMAKYKVSEAQKKTAGQFGDIMAQYVPPTRDEWNRILEWLKKYARNEDDARILLNGRDDAPGNWSLDEIARRLQMPPVASQPKPKRGGLGMLEFAQWFPIGAYDAAPLGVQKERGAAGHLDLYALRRKDDGKVSLVWTSGREGQTVYSYDQSRSFMGGILEPVALDRATENGPWMTAAEAAEVASGRPAPPSPGMAKAQKRVQQAHRERDKAIAAGDPDAAMRAMQKLEDWLYERTWGRQAGTLTALEYDALKQTKEGVREAAEARRSELRRQRAREEARGPRVAPDDINRALREGRGFATYFDLDESSPTFMLWSTREHGDVEEERPGQRDIDHAASMARFLRSRFGERIKATVNTAGEWTNLEVELNPVAMKKAKVGGRVVFRKPTGEKSEGTVHTMGRKGATIIDDQSGQSHNVEHGHYMHDDGDPDEAPGEEEEDQQPEPDNLGKGTTEGGIDTDALVKAARDHLDLGPDSQLAVHGAAAILAVHGARGLEAMQHNDVQVSGKGVRAGGVTVNDSHLVATMHHLLQQVGTGTTVFAFKDYRGQRSPITKESLTDYIQRYGRGPDAPTEKAEMRKAAQAVTEVAEMRKAVTAIYAQPVVNHQFVIEGLPGFEFQYAHNGRIGVCTVLRGPNVGPIPFHEVVASPRLARQNAAEMAKAFLAGRLPARGVFRRMGVLPTKETDDGD